MAERAPHTMGQDARVKHVNFNSSDVIRIDTHLRVNTAIELGNGETISSILLGDSESYEVEVLSNRNTISVKPIIGGASTNMTVYTNRRAISFFLTEGRGGAKTFRVAVVFPDTRRSRTSTASSANKVRSSGYQFAGDASFRPSLVWNDGTNTFFEFKDSTRPSIFRVNSSGYEVTTNFASKGNVVRVAGIANEYSIRIGDEVVCIRRIDGGTVTSARNNTAFAQREF